MVFIASIIYSEAIETGIILLIDQVAVVIFENKQTKVSDFGTSERLLKKLLLLGALPNKRVYPHI